MPNRTPPAKWTLPEVVAPDTTRCFVIRVPNDALHVAAFRGALLNLASARQWQDDPDHKAREVALVWQSTIDNMEDCGVGDFDVRQSDAPCILEKSDDGGVTWVEWANLQLCPPRLRTGPDGIEWWDGTGWQPLPDQGDERQDGTYDPPWPDPPEGETGNCLAAENIVAVLSTTLEQTRASLEAGAIALIVSTTITGILSAFIAPAVFAAVANAMALALVEGGISLLDECIDTDNMDALKCAINCHAESDGSITASEFTDIYDELNLTVSNVLVRSIYQYFMDSMGPVGLSRMGRAGDITSGSCDDCQCGVSTIRFYRPNPFTLMEERVIHVGDVVAEPYYDSQGHHGVNIRWQVGCCNLFDIITLTSWSGLPGYDNWSYTYCDESGDHGGGSYLSPVNELSNGTFWSNQGDTVFEITITEIVNG